MKTRKSMITIGVTLSLLGSAVANDAAARLPVLPRPAMTVPVESTYRGVAVRSSTAHLTRSDKASTTPTRSELEQAAAEGQLTPAILQFLQAKHASGEPLSQLERSAVTRAASSGQLSRSAAAAILGV